MDTDIALGIQKIHILRCSKFVIYNQGLHNISLWSLLDCFCSYEVLLRVTHQLSITTRATNLYGWPALAIMPLYIEPMLLTNLVFPDVITNSILPCTIENPSNQ